MNIISEWIDSIRRFYKLLFLKDFEFEYSTSVKNLTGETFGYPEDIREALLNSHGIDIRDVFANSYGTKTNVTTYGNNLEKFVLTTNDSRDQPILGFFK